MRPVGRVPGWPAEQQPSQAQPQQTTGYLPPTQDQQQDRRGGAIARRDLGGGMSISQADPWWTRQEARGEVSGGSGFLAGSTPGRADSIRTTAPAGSYVIPADVVAGLGEGNSLAGARVLQEIMASGPYGTPVGRPGPQRRIPQPVAPMQTPSQAKGGPTPGAGQVPVLLSHGEFVVVPEHVRAIGRGNLKMGHKILDRWVVHERGRQIAKLKKLPGPVKEAA